MTGLSKITCTTFQALITWARLSVTKSQRFISDGTMAERRMRPSIMGNVRTGGPCCGFTPIRERLFTSRCDSLAALETEGGEAAGFSPFLHGLEQAASCMPVASLSQFALLCRDKLAVYAGKLSGLPLWFGRKNVSLSMEHSQQADRTA